MSTLRMPTKKRTLITLIYASAQLLVLGEGAGSTAASVSNSLGCHVYRAPSACEHYHLVSQLRFHAFIDRRALDTTCSQSQTAMSCVDNLLVGCNSVVRMPFDMQKAVLNAVCRNRKQEFLDSSNCFSIGSLQQRIALRCLSQASNERRMRIAPCRLTEDIISCGAEAVRMTDGCDVQDSQLMAGLLFDFLSVICETWKAGKSGN
ncbi:hypothetical protein EGW08_004871 [Elysia chlorotica]|uniref:DUF19 domain-containing protein n=1 Tax=Elysia chlorotica TaxID=188477 RepID=A0A3S0ZVY6_ELYCH|nr:hypothetical protein EGW08_004871 [Elysia chlorotica]